MMKAIEREIISRETIKPSSPTPPHLRSYKISLLDQISPSIHVHFVLFYPYNQNLDDQPKFADRLLQLKKSLSETLTHYYPFAGRKKEVSIDCNDEGVELFESQINCDMSEILKDPYTGKLKLLFPASDLLDMSCNLLVVQATQFECGGVAVGVSISHTLSDASTISTFMNDWARKARSSGNGISPQFIASSIFPPNDLSSLPAAEVEGGNCVTKRYVFNASSIATLKDMAKGSSGVENPTRVELVTALILKCAVAASMANLGYLKTTCAVQAVNLRKRMIPPLPNNAIGNMVWVFPIIITMEREVELCNLVGKYRDGMENFKKMEVLKFRGDKWYPFICQTVKQLEYMFNINNQINQYRCTSWCKLGMYDVDFGWGKAIWLGMGNTELKNTIILNDTSKGDEIEATIILEEQEMALFERDVDILAYASTN